MKIKKLLATVLTGAMTFSLVACGSSGGSLSGGSNSDDKTLTIWAWDDTFNVEAANIAKEKYEKEHPDVTVNVVSMAQDDVVQKLNTSLSSGTYDGLPNVVLIEDYRIQNYLKAYPGEIKDLSEYIDPNNFMEYKTKIMSEDGKIYGVPFDSGVAALFYRKDLVEQAGYTEADMQDITWEKYIEVGKAVKEKTGVDWLTMDPSDLNQLRIMMQSAGSWYVNENGEVNLANNEALKDAINIYRQMLDANIVKKVSGWDAFVAAFQTGDVASVANGCWINSSIKAAEDQSGKWAVAAIPRMGADPKSVNASNSGGSSWYVLDKVGNSDLAADFLKETFGSNQELMNDLLPAIGLVATMKDASAGSNYAKGDDFYGGQTIYKNFAEWTNNIPAVNYGLDTYNIENIMAEGMQKIVNGADVDTTLKDTEEQAKTAISK